MTDELAGTWVFNDTIDIGSREQRFAINFTSNNTQYDDFYLAGNEKPKYLSYGSTTVGGTVYGDSDGWTNEAYKTIIITSKLSEVTNGDTLLAWLQANATKQAPTVARKSVDLTTLSGWSSLSSDTYSITIVAKADGYRDSEPSAAVSVTKAAMPVKGDIITLDSKQYRVLKTEGTVAEVLCMYDASTSQKFDASGNSNVYANSSLDVYLSQTFYDSLSTTMQNAIVAKTFQQDSWYYGSNSSAIAKYNGTYQTTNNYTLSLMSTTFGASISRKCYVLSCQDVIDYLEVTTSMGSADTALTSENVWRMFWNQTTSPGSTYLWLRSAYFGSSIDAFYVIGRSGRLSNRNVGSATAVRPAFQIDLSKIEWTKSATLISFTIAGTSYQAEEGMTWEQWVNSSYNTGGYIVSGDSIYKPSGRQGFVYDNVVMSDVKVTDTIISSRAYIVQTGGSSGN